MPGSTCRKLAVEITPRELLMAWYSAVLQLIEKLFMVCFLLFIRQCALTLAQLCNSMTLGVLQSHCRDSLYYRVARDAPSDVDLGQYMFRQTEEFMSVGGSDIPPRKVAHVVCFDFK